MMKLIFLSLTLLTVIDAVAVNTEMYLYSGQFSRDEYLRAEGRRQEIVDAPRVTPEIFEKS